MFKIYKNLLYNTIYIKLLKRFQIIMNKFNRLICQSLIIFIKTRMWQSKFLFTIGTVFFIFIRRRCSTLRWRFSYRRAFLFITPGFLYIHAQKLLIFVASFHLWIYIIFEFFKIFYLIFELYFIKLLKCL